MKPIIRKGRQPALRTIGQARDMLRRVEATPAYPATKLAFRLLMLTALRPGTLITTPWAEIHAIDPNDPIWVISPLRLKMAKAAKNDPDKAHRLPIAKQSLQLLKTLQTLSIGSPYVFPSPRSPQKPLSENALCYLLNRAGYHHKHVPHGCRATFSTIMNERHRNTHAAVIDGMLGHTPKDKVEGAYNRAEHLDLRRELAQEWADLLLKDFPSPASLLDGPVKHGYWREDETPY